MDEIMNHVPHSTYEDEPRFIVSITQLIKDGELPVLKHWESSVKDEKAKLVRKKQGEKEAQEAEALAKELGVWDEFYGSGKAGARKGKGKTGKGKGKDTAENDGDSEEDTSALQALILQKRKKMDGFFDDLAAKYAEPETKGKGKKGKKRAGAADEEDGQMPGKKAKAAALPDIDDEEFEKLQQKLFGDKARAAQGDADGKAKGAKAVRGRRAK